MKKMVALFLTVAMLMSLTGSVGLAEETIDMWVQIDWLEAATVEAERFMAENPGVKINIMEAGDDYHTKIMLSVSSGEFPDIFSIDSPEVPMALDYIAPLSEEAVAAYKEKLTPGALELGLINGQYYAIPLQIPTYPIWIANQTIFDELNLEIPTTFEEMLEVAPKLQLRNDDGTVARYPYYIQSAPGQWSGWFNWHYLLMANGGSDVVSADKQTVTLDTPETRRVLKFFQELAQNEYVLVDGSNEPGCTAYLVNGLVAMGEEGCWMGDSLYTGYVDEEAQLIVEENEAAAVEFKPTIVTPTVMTAADDKSLVQASGWVLCLNKNAPENARKFWEQLLTVEFDQNKGVSGPLMKVNREQNDLYKEPFWQDYFSYAEYAQAYPNLKFGMSLQVILGDMFEQVFFGADIDTAIQDASNQIAEVLVKENQ